MDEESNVKMFGMCIDKRVVVGGVTAAGLLWWLAPATFASALPFLILAICPLSMLLMMKAMNMGGQPPSGGTMPPTDEPAPGGDIAAASAAAADLDARRN